MITGYITHDDAMIKTFRNDPEYAEIYLSEVLKDGDDDEIQRVKNWISQAQIQDNFYWNNAPRAKVATA